MEFNCLKGRATSSLLSTTEFPEIPGTHFTYLEKMKVFIDLGFEHATQWF